MKMKLTMCCLAIAALTMVATGAWAGDVWTFDDGLGAWEWFEESDDGLRFFWGGEAAWLCDEGGKLTYTDVADEEGDSLSIGLTYLYASPKFIYIDEGNQYFVVSIDATGVAGQTMNFAVRTLPSNKVRNIPMVMQDGLQVYAFDVRTAENSEDGVVPAGDDRINLIRMDLPTEVGRVYEIDWAAFDSSASFTPATQSTTCGGDPEPEPEPAAPAIAASSAFPIDGQNFSLTAPDGAVAGYVWQKVGGAVLDTTTATHEFEPITEADAGTYSVTYDDGEVAKTEIVLTIALDVLPAGNELPLTGLLGLGLLAGACAFGGTSILRRKQ